MKVTTHSQVFALIMLSVIEVSISLLTGDSGSVPVCEVSDTYVDCRNKNLTEVPKLPNLPESVTHLDFSFNNIRKISSIDVPFPLSILDISFSHNIIDTVVNGVFGNTTNLLRLDLSYNKIKGSVLHTEPFYLDIGQLRKLNLRGNDLETIDDETFSPFGISNIEYLDISHCSLKSLGYSIHNLGSLKFLNLSYNLLTKFEDSLTGDINLETLDLSFNKIITVKKVPAVLSLKSLYLDYNGLEAARVNAFQSLLGLKVLSLVGNNLKTLRPHTFPLDSLFIELQEIRLDKNPWRCDCNMKWLLKDVSDVSGFRNFTLKCAYPSRLRGKNIFDSSSTELTCAEHYSRLTYILILFFSSCFMVTAIGYLIYFKRKHFPCHKERKGHYIAVYTNDDANADEGSSVKITTADDESLVNNEEITVFENKTVQYFDV